MNLDNEGETRQQQGQKQRHAASDKKRGFCGGVAEWAVGGGWCVFRCHQTPHHPPPLSRRTCNLGCLLNFIKPFQNANERTHTSCQQPRMMLCDASPEKRGQGKGPGATGERKEKGAWQSCNTYKHRRHVPNRAKRSGGHSRAK